MDVVCRQGPMVEFLLGLWWVVVEGSGFGSMIWTRIVRVVEFLLVYGGFLLMGVGLGHDRA